MLRIHSARGTREDAHTGATAVELGAGGGVADVEDVGDAVEGDGGPVGAVLQLEGGRGRGHSDDREELELQAST